MCVGGGETQHCLGRFAPGVRSDGAATTLGDGLSASPLEGRNLATVVISGQMIQSPELPAGGSERHQAPSPCNAQGRCPSYRGTSASLSCGDGL